MIEIFFTITAIIFWFILFILEEILILKEKAR